MMATHTDAFVNGLRDRINAAKRSVGKDEQVVRALELDLKEAVDMVEHAAHAALAALLVVRVLVFITSPQQPTPWSIIVYNMRSCV